MIFSPRNKPATDQNIFINNEKITRVKETKFLGVILDQGLSWKQHIFYIKNKIAKTTGIMYKARQKLGRRYLITLYNTLVLPYLSYCNIIWCSTYESYLKPLIIMQKKVLRCVCNLKAKTSTPLYFKSTSILKLTDINQFQIMNFMFNYQKGNLPDIFQSFFKYNHEIHSYSTRQSNLFRPPNYKTLLGKMFIKYKGVIIWNSLTKHVSADSTRFIFKKQLKTYFISSY